MSRGYTLGLFANMYPAFEGDYRGIFIQQMVRDLESRGVIVKKAVKVSPSLAGYASFYYRSLILSRCKELDILQADYIPHSSLIPAVFKHANLPLVLKFHGDDARIYPFNNRFNMALTRYMLNRAAYIITASEEMRRILTGLGTNPEKISAIHTGVDTTFFSPLSKEEIRTLFGLSQKSTIFLFVGRLHLWKGIREIIEVARYCPNQKFVFIGPGAIPSHTDNCTFLGTQLPETVRLWMNAADCLVLPTYTEAIPTVVMEAFACGIPAITSNIGGCPEIVEHGKNGLLVSVQDSNSLKNAVEWIDAHPEERNEMGIQARLTVLEKFDHNKLCEKLIDVHKKQIEKG